LPHVVIRHLCVAWRYTSQQQNRLTVGLLVTAVWDNVPCYGITQSRLADAICQN